MGDVPEFVYRPLDDDPAVTRPASPRSTVERRRMPRSRHLLQAKRRELELQLEMLRRRGSDEFLALSIELYGAVSPALLGEAEALLDCGQRPGRRDAVNVSMPTAFARRAEAELDHYRATGSTSTSTSRFVPTAAASWCRTATS